MKNLHLIMPMGGAGSRFTKENYELPKPLLVIHNKSFFYWATRSITKYINVLDITFVVLKEHIEKFNIDKEIHKYFPDANIKVIPKVLNGAVLTCLVGIEDIKDDNPILFNDCDHMFCSKDFNNYIKDENAACDGALLTFKSDVNKYSYILYDKNGTIIGTKEKQVVSDDAICGAYYFKNANLFKTMVEEYLKKCSYSEYYVSGVYNIMASKKMNIRKFDVDFHLPFGTPEEYEQALKSPYFKELL